MKISQDDKKRFEDWINTKCGIIRCTCCGMRNWTLMDTSTLAIGFDLHTTRFHYAQGIAQITIACTNCGHMLFFSPLIMGFAPDQPIPTEVPMESMSDEPQNAPVKPSRKQNVEEKA